MNIYRPRPHRRWLRRITMMFVVLVVLGSAAAAASLHWYNDNLQPASTSTTTQYITISNGATLHVIAQQLADAHLIRNASAFTLYITLHQARATLQAGTYALTPSDSVRTIAAKLIHGSVATDLFTILPGQRLDAIRQAFIHAGFSAAAVDTALSAGQYRASYTFLAAAPADATLEGFLYPDSFQKSATTTPGTIVRESLDEMASHLTSDVQSGFAAQGLNVYQGVTLASIVEQEVTTQSDRDQAAQVFLKRLHTGMPLGSDVTAFYGAVIAGATPSVTYDSMYNTRLHTSLPPGPIGNVNDSALAAVAHPAATDWLYFVAGDDGVTHFAKTEAEHEANVARYCHALCQGSA